MYGSFRRQTRAMTTGFLRHLQELTLFDIADDSLIAFGACNSYGYEYHLQQYTVEIALRKRKTNAGIETFRNERKPQSEARRTIENHHLPKNALKWPQVLLIECLHRWEGHEILPTLTIGATVAHTICYMASLC